MKNIREIIHPTLVKIFSLAEKTPIVCENENSLKGYKGGVLYTPKHSNVHDFPVLTKALGEHVYVLVGNDIKNGLVNTVMLWLNGVIFVDRTNKEDCKKAKEKIIKLLSKGKKVAMFVEGSWGLDEVNPIHDFKWGFADIAKKTHVPIVPVGMEYNIEDSCHVKFMDPMYVNEDDDLATKQQELREALSTSVWDIFELQGEKKRDDDYNNIKKSYHDYVDKSLQEFPYNIGYERELIFNRHEDPTEVVGPTYRPVEERDRIYARCKGYTLTKKKK